MSIIGTVLVIGGLTVVDGLRGAAKATKIDEKTLKKLGQAYEKEIEAKRIVKDKEESADKSLGKVINRKKAILTTSMPAFFEVYEQIQKLKFAPGKGIKELENLSLSVETISEIKQMTIVAKKPLTNTELIVGTFLLGPAFGGGLGGMFIKDSERELAAANSQLRIAETMHSQAETYCTAYDAIIQRADRIATILSKLDLLFDKSIKTTRSLISDKGYNLDKYNDNEVDVVMTCVNMSKAVKQYLDVPLLDKTGYVTEASLKAIETGNQYISEIENVVKYY